MNYKLELDTIAKELQRMAGNSEWAVNKLQDVTQAIENLNNTIQTNELNQTLRQPLFTPADSYKQIYEFYYQHADIPYQEQYSTLLRMNQNDYRKTVIEIEIAWYDDKSGLIKDLKRL